jgi:16S rRNA (cytosine967-C5)-methyltransferase
VNLDPRLRVRLETPTPARAWVLETLDAASADPRRATSALRAASRDARKLRSRERRALWDVVYELVRHRDALVHRTAASGWEALLAAWLADPAIPPDLPDAVRLGCPPAIAADLRATYGEALDAWLQASNARAPAFLRANLARTTPQALADRLRRDGIETRPAGEHGLEVVGRANLLGNPAWREGLFEVQDLASQRVAALTAPQGLRVLDLCAGAGGKALAMAALGGRVVATDIRSRALDELRNRATRARARIEVRVLDRPADEILEGRTFDRVLVDAPCTGTGVWRRHPEFRWRLGPDSLAELSDLQHTLIRTGADRVAPSGWLVYATCSALRSENEAVVERFLAEVPGWRRLREDFRTAPHLDGTDGMYAAILTRDG